MGESEAGTVIASMATREIGIFALPTVLVPGERMPLHIFEDRYKRLIGDCMKQEDDFLLLSDVFPTGYHGNELADVRPGDSVAVYGGGPVGLMAAYSAMSIAGGAVGLILGGVLTTYLSWRWVLFVNVPIGLLVVLLAPRVLGESKRLTGRFDLPGAITGTVGLAALVYGLSSAATSPNGVSHWGAQFIGFFDCRIRFFFR